MNAKDSAAVHAAWAYTEARAAAERTAQARQRAAWVEHLEVITHEGDPDRLQRLADERETREALRAAVREEESAWAAWTDALVRAHGCEVGRG
jgi:hypothetical protein